LAKALAAAAGGSYWGEAEARPVVRAWESSGQSLRVFAATHGNQHAAYRDIIPRNRGTAVSMRGNAFTEPATMHFEFHRELESFWDLYRPGGARFGGRPTNAEYGQALKRALEVSGKSPDEADWLVKLALEGRKRFGLQETDLVPRIPGPIRQKKT
jgi:hypothetical protein